MLFSAWSDQPFRATRDLDFLGQGDGTVAATERAVKEICRTSVEDDGLEFLGDTIEGDEIREDQEYRGVRLRFEARLAGARIPMQILADLDTELIALKRRSIQSWDFHATTPFDFFFAMYFFIARRL